MAVSVVDATIAEVAEGAAKPVVIMTSDGGDMTALAGRITGDVRVLPQNVGLLINGSMFPSRFRLTARN